MLRAICNWAIPDLGGDVGTQVQGVTFDPRMGIFDSFGGVMEADDSVPVTAWEWPDSAQPRDNNDRYFLSLGHVDNKARGLLAGSDSIPAPSGAATIIFYSGYIQMLSDGGTTTSQQYGIVFYQHRDDIIGNAFAIMCHRTSGAAFSLVLYRCTSVGQASTGSQKTGLALSNFQRNPLYLLEFAFRISDGFIRWWVDGTEITAGFTDFSGGNTMVCDGRVHFDNIQIGAGKGGAATLPVTYSQWVLYDDAPTGNISDRIGTGMRTMLHAVKCDVTGEDDFTPDPDPGSGLHWSNIDDENDDDYPDATDSSPTDVLKLAANTTGDQMGAVQTQDGGSASILGVCLFLNYTNTTGSSPNLFPTDFDFLAFLDGAALSTYSVLGYAAYENWGWWVNLPEKPGGGNWTVSDFNNLRVGIRRTTANASDFHLRQIVAVAVGTNLAQPTPTIASPVACTVDGPVAPPAAAFVPRVSIY